jgi:hypothetical protein
VKLRKFGNAGKHAEEFVVSSVLFEITLQKIEDYECS